uniref:5-hydroxytryptamine receptor 3E n=1 Tax=Panthera tigris altaica TaxID=74533 RepID=A0A8C9KRQ0_PANTA
ILPPRSYHRALSHRQQESSLPLLTHSMSSTGRGSTFIINCSGFGQHGGYPTVLDSVFERKAFRPVTNFSIPTLVNISFTMSAILDVVWDNPFIRWNPEECEGITKISVATKNLWLPDIFIVELYVLRAGNSQREAPFSGISRIYSLMNVDKTPKGLTAYVSNEGRIRYKKPMKVTSICNLDIFYFPFDQQNCTLTFSSFLYTGESLWGLRDKIKYKEIMNKCFQIPYPLPFLSSPKVAIRRRPRLYIINLLVPSGFLVAIDALSFYLPAESGNRAPFKITLLLGYNVFLLMMNELLPTNGTPLISVYFALCLSLMVVSLLETIFITYLLHLATSQPPPMPQWLHSLILYCTSPTKCCPTALQKRNKAMGLPAAHLPGVKEPVELVGKMPGPRETELNGCPGSTKAQQEDETQKQHLADLWVQFSHMMDTLLFRLYLLFMTTSVVTVIVLWNT